MTFEALAVDAQIQWRGVLLGGGTAYGWHNLEGWYDLPEQRGENAPLPAWHGSFPGRKTSGDRVVTYDYITKTASMAEFRAATRELRRITAPTEDPVEEPLVVHLDGESLLAWARCTRRIIPTDRHYAVGVAHGSVQWEATDPRLYSVYEQTREAQLAVPGSSGLDFGSGGLDFGSGGLDFGGGQQGGVLTATNAGHVPTWPTIEIVGPVPGPNVTFGGRHLKFDPGFVVLAGQTVVIDTRPTWRTVEINGVSVRQHLLIDQWTALEPDVDTQIQFTAAAYDPAARLVVRWRDAWH